MRRRVQKGLVIGRVRKLEPRWQKAKETREKRAQYASWRASLIALSLVAMRTYDVLGKCPLGCCSQYIRYSYICVQDIETSVVRIPESILSAYVRGGGREGMEEEHVAIFHKNDLRGSQG